MLGHEMGGVIAAIEHGFQQKEIAAIYDVDPSRVCRYNQA